MDETKDDYQPSKGLVYAIAGVSVFVVGGLILANSHDEDPLFLLGLALEGTGIYLLLAGAVARGIQMARGQSVKHR
ncbi:MAG TPA: hypothetical protein VLA97_13070 [Nocardioidaceae bacterium]|nr:hypothetical protein [Nocardioidaceae bacterium]